MCKKPDIKFLAWFDDKPEESFFASVLSIGEIRKGVDKLQSSKKKEKLRNWLEFELQIWFDNRILAIDADVANKWGEVLAMNSKTLSAIDSLIAATALQYNLRLVTRNTKDFDIAGLELINPWQLD